MAGPIALVNGKASVPPPGFTTTEAGVYQWVADYGGDSQQHRGAGYVRQGTVTIGKMPTSITMRRRTLTVRRSVQHSLIRQR